MKMVGLAGSAWTTRPPTGICCGSITTLSSARRPFPGERIRTLDAIHLASALVARAAVEELTLLSLDRRVRSTAAALGLPLLPA